MMNNTIRLSVISSVNDHDSVSKLILYYNDYNPEGMGWGKREQNKNEKKKYISFFLKIVLKTIKKCAGETLETTTRTKEIRHAVQSRKTKSKTDFSLFFCFFVFF